MFKKQIILRGMRRSGNHALANWITAQSGWIFLNNVVNIGPTVRRNEPPPDAGNFEIWLLRRAKAFRQSPLRLLSSRVVVGLEDHVVDYQPFTPSRRGQLDVLLLRDPANLFASRIRKAYRLPVHNPVYAREAGADLCRVVDLWKAYAREFIGETNHLPGKVAICYDAWFTSASYRRHVAERLGIPFTDAAFGRMSSEGGGSSFDGYRHDMSAEGLRVLDRSQQLDAREQEVLAQIMADGELTALWQSARQRLGERAVSGAQS
jgi:hypothetical protein